MSFHDLWIFRLFYLPLFTSFFLYIALRGLISRKPFLHSTKWYFGLMAMILLPGFVPLMISTHGLNLSFINWFFLPVTLLTLVIFWKAFNGYTVYGATDQSFRKSLLSSLDQSNLKYTEDMTGIHLSSYDITLKATFMMGSGQLRIKGKDPEKVIEKILPILKKELEKPGVDLKPFLFYFGMAVIFLVFGFVELSLFQKIGNY